MGKPVRSRFGKVVSKIQIGDLVNFVPESRLPFAQISSIYQKIGRESIKLISKVALKKWNKNFRETFRLEKQDYLFRCSITGNFPPENVNGKHPHRSERMIERGVCCAL